VTTTKYPEHTQAVRERIAQIAADRDALLNAGLRVLGAGGANIFMLDFLAVGTVKRYLSTASAFQLMIETWNLVCARSLLRMHIDTGLRFSAAWLVKDPHAFASSVLGGARIDKLTDVHGRRLSDAHLAQVRSAEYPWLPAVYKSLSGYVHFSASHIFDSIATMDEETRTVHFNISDTDTKFPEFSWLEVTECFIEATELLSRFLLGYAATKNGARAASSA
jgi:hypothetical protein